MPGAKLQLPQLWHSCLAGQWQLAKTSRICCESVGAQIHLHTCIVSVGQLLIQEAVAAIGGQIEWKSMCMEGWSMGWWEEGCMWQGGGGFEGYWVDDCPPFVLQIRGNLLAIVAPCCSPARELREGISAPQSRWCRFFSKPSSLGLLFYPLCLFLLSLRFVLDAVHSQPRPAIV